MSIDISIVFALIGAVIGLGLAGGPGFVFGAAAGFLAGRVKQLSDRLTALEKDKPAAGLANGWEGAAPVRESVDPRGEAAGTSAPLTPAPPREGSTAAPMQRVEAHAPPPPRDESPGTAQAPPQRRTHPTDRTASAVTRVAESVKEWFTSGNLPVKVGVVLSLFGVAFLVREAIDRQLFDLPIEWRLAGVAAFGFGLLIVGWLLRERRRGYSLSVQGGGIAVLYLTAYAAFALYGLLPATAAFAALLVVTVAGGTLAVLQDSLALAVLGIVGGFMAPVLASTGAGDHVLLFSYYAVLNIAVIGVAWFKAWRALNVLGFIFTFGIGSLWGYQGYSPEHFATTEPFLVLFVLMYTVIPVLFSHRQAPNLRGVVDGTLVFGTPIAGFGLQTRLIGDSGYGLAFSALALAGLYLVLSACIHRTAKDLRALMESFFGLGIVFLAIAAPLALDARWTSVAWALQGAAMVWLSCRQRRRLALWAGLALQLLAGLSFIDQPGLYAAATTPLLNGVFLSAAWIALAGWFSGWQLDHGGSPESAKPLPALLRWLLLGWSTAWWLWAGFVEVGRVPGLREVGGLAFVAVTAGVAAFAAGRLKWPRLDAVSLILMPTMALALLLALIGRSHPLAGYGWLAWPAAFGVHYAFLWFRENRFPRLLPVLHAGAYWIIAALIAGETRWLVGQAAPGIWPAAASIAAAAAFVLATLQARETVPWPVGTHWNAYLRACAGGVLLAVMAAVLATNLLSPGDPAPLPYLPVLNPLALTSLFSLFAVWRWQLAGRRHRYTGRLGFPVAAVTGLFLLTMAVVRAVHHWAAVPFAPEALAESVVLQSSLSLVWGVTGLLGMVLGARSNRRALWIGGALLMTAVVVKLFLVELDNTGTVGRVVSFLGVGVLLLIVGYFAPAPPRSPAAAETPSAS